MGNSFGKILTLTTFGESHGEAVGGVLDGFPSDISIDYAFLQSEIDRRKPADDFFSTSRKESDTIKIISGIFNGRSTGAPIAFLFENNDIKPGDYENLKEIYRPSHADFTYHRKYRHRDYRGGGRASARETISRVAGGALAKILLSHCQVAITSEIFSIGPFNIPSIPSGLKNPELQAYLQNLKAGGDTTGGVLSVTITGVPVGLGEPVFDKLHADLARAMFSIPSVRGFEIGAGFAAASMKGSDHNDPFIMADGKIKTVSNHSGGVQGGISNGMDIIFRIAFKPVSTLMREQTTVTHSGEKVVFKAGGRHDVCVVPRAAVVAEAMAALVLGDHLLISGLFRR